MDLMKWIKSLDELLFELMSWLVFWPVTLVRTALRPIAMMRYADEQLRRPEADQYDEALSPPVFLILTLAIAHVVALALGQSDAIIENQQGVASLIRNDSAAVLVRLVMFAAFPLIFASLLIAARQRPLNRRNLQPPFYAQCYPAAIFAAALSTAGQLSFEKLIPAGIFMAALLAAAAWFAIVEAIWFRRIHGLGRVIAAALSIAGIAAGVTLVIAVALILDPGAATA